mgnify:CR=1 FL=1
MRHVAVGVSSPIPGSAALLTQHRSHGQTRVSILQSRTLQFFTNGGVEIFDMAGQGRIDAFFLGGGQIDGEANVNLVGVGDYPQQKVRWSGSFGAAYLYYLVPRVILFREEHSRRVLVPRVDFISAPGWSPPYVVRPGGPARLLEPEQSPGATAGRCLEGGRRCGNRRRGRRRRPPESPPGRPSPLPRSRRQAPCVSSAPSSP